MKRVMIAVEARSLPRTLRSISGGNYFQQPAKRLQVARSDPSSDAHFHETTQRFWLLELIREVHDDGVYVRLAPIQRSFRRIPTTRIRDASVLPYAATSYGGWHWGLRRAPSGNTVYRLHGGRGIELTRTDGTSVFIGTQRPKAFAAAIRQVVDAD